MKRGIVLTEVILGLFLLVLFVSFASAADSEICLTVIGWRIDNYSCVSDNGCDYDADNFYYATEEECEEALRYDFEVCPAPNCSGAYKSGEYDENDCPIYTCPGDPKSPGCDAHNPCEKGWSCVKLPGKIYPECVYGDPCITAGCEDECVIKETYPSEVVCLDEEENDDEEKEESEEEDGSILDKITNLRDTEKDSEKSNDGRYDEEKEKGLFSKIFGFIRSLLSLIFGFIKSIFSWIFG